MKQEDKDLLFKDLCARLPYGVKVTVKHYNHVWNIFSISPNGLTYITNYSDYPFATNFEECKPYLFPLSSMSEEQKEKYCQLQQKVIYNSKGVVNKDVTEYVNWCYKNHLDINDLIPQGLALDTTGLNIY